MATRGDQMVIVNVTLLGLAIFALVRRLKSGYMFERKLHHLTVFLEANLVATVFVALIAEIFEYEKVLIFLIELCLLYLAVGFGFMRLVALIEKRVVLMRDPSASDCHHIAVRLLFLIESAKTNDFAEFALRGLLEQHIEACEFEACNCVSFYAATNSIHRLELGHTKYTTLAMNDSEGASAHDVEELRDVIGQIATDQENEEESKLDIADVRKRRRIRFFIDFLRNLVDGMREIFPRSPPINHFRAFIWFAIIENNYKAMYFLSFLDSMKTSIMEDYNAFVLRNQIISSHA